jgi:hypothetical protein
MLSTLTVLAAVSCPSAMVCTADGYFTNRGGDYVTPAERWNGNRWSIQASPNPVGTGRNFLLGASCPSANACGTPGYSYNVTLAEGYLSAWQERSAAACEAQTPRRRLRLGRSAMCATDGAGRVSHQQAARYALRNRRSGPSSGLLATRPTRVARRRQARVGSARSRRATQDRTGPTGSSRT